jgi:hypothetical protein
VFLGLVPFVVVIQEVAVLLYLYRQGGAVHKPRGSGPDQEAQGEKVGAKAPRRQAQRPLPKKNQSKLSAQA